MLHTDWFSCSVPAIHLFGLQVASIFKQLNVIEEEADHPFGLFQIRLHLGGVLRGLPGAHQPHVLQQRRKNMIIMGLQMFD